MNTFPVLIENDIAATMRDGAVLHATVYRPAAPAGMTFPVLLTRTPYGRDQGTNSAYLNPPALAARGFVVILQDCRGRFGSEGIFDPSVHEEADGADTAEWAAALPYSNGTVGMWGRSYFAETSGVPPGAGPLACGRWRRASRPGPMPTMVPSTVAAPMNSDPG